MRDANGISRFKQLERSLGVDFENRILNVRVGRGVRAACDQLVLGVDVLGGGAADRGTLCDHHVPRLRDREVRLSRDNQAKGLKISKRLKLGVAMMIESDLAQVVRAPLW